MNPILSYSDQTAFGVSSSADTQFSDRCCMVYPNGLLEPVSYRRFAMQPIFTLDRNLMAFELFYRGAKGDHFHAKCPDLASNTIIDNLLLFGFEELSMKSLLFINCTRETLTGGYFSLLPRHAVIEILETVQPDAEVLAACRDLKDGGHCISIDDFRDPETMRPFLDLADFVKIDFRDSDAEERYRLGRELEGRNLIHIAEKIETEAEFREAADEGFCFFQGNYLRPATSYSKATRSPCPLRLQQLADLLANPHSTVDQKIDCLSRVPEIETRLLRRAAWKAPNGATCCTIPEALEIVGTVELCQLLGLAMLTSAPV